VYVTKITEAQLGAGRKIGIKVNHNAEQNDNLLNGNKSFENVSKFHIFENDISK
jgi:hypothetical protein